MTTLIQTRSSLWPDRHSNYALTNISGLASIPGLEKLVIEEGSLGFLNLRLENYFETGCFRYLHLLELVFWRSDNIL